MLPRELELQHLQIFISLFSIVIEHLIFSCITLNEGYTSSFSLQSVTAMRRSSVCCKQKLCA